MSSHAATAVRLAEEERDHLIRPARTDRNRTPRPAHLPQLLQPTAQHLCGTFGVPAFQACDRFAEPGSWPEEVKNTVSVPRAPLPCSVTRDRFHSFDERPVPDA